MASDEQGDSVFAKIKLFSMIVAAFVVTHAVAVSAIEPLDMSRVTAEDKFYFVSRLNHEQLEGLKRVFNPSRMKKSRCEDVAEIIGNLTFLKTLTPILQEASTSADVSPYTRKYSAVLVKRINGTSKGRNLLMHYYRKSCATAREAGSRPD